MVRMVAQRNDIVTSSKTLTPMNKSQKIFFCTAKKILTLHSKNASY